MADFFRTGTSKYDHWFRTHFRAVHSLLKEVYTVLSEGALLVFVFHFVLYSNLFTSHLFGSPLAFFLELVCFLFLSRLKTITVVIFSSDLTHTVYIHMYTNMASTPAPQNFVVSEGDGIEPSTVNQCSNA
jgi:hypothetical protein